jgi:hypothetical protein
VDSADAAAPVGWNAPGYGVQNKARRICVESEQAEQILLVTFIGSSPVPVEIRVDHCTVVCSNIEKYAGTHGNTGDENLFPDATAVWRLEIDGNQITYALGCAAARESKTQRTLNGVGNCPVTVRSVALSSIS